MTENKKKVTKRKRATARVRRRPVMNHPVLESERYLVVAAVFFSNFLRKVSMRPAVSTNFWRPVKYG